IAERANDRVGGFSRGMKQRLSLARALVHDPDLLFLDEPTAGLDPAATQQLHQTVRQMARTRGRTVVLCTHNLVEAQALSDRVVRRSRALMTPLIVLPVLLMIVFPTVFTFLPRMLGGARSAFAEMFRNMPDPMKRQFGEFTEATWIRVVHTQMLAPLMLLVPF